MRFATGNPYILPFFSLRCFCDVYCLWSVTHVKIRTSHDKLAYACTANITLELGL